VEFSFLDDSQINSIIQDAYKLLRHRGPDNQSYKIIRNDKMTIVLVHTRLRIIGDTSAQPISVGSVDLIINGEIFNWKELSKELGYICTKSDCEIIIPLYEKYKDNLNTFFSKLNGQFSFVLYDSSINKIFVGRDHVGVTPLYYGQSPKRLIFSSEMKVLSEMKLSTIASFYPRNYIYDEVFSGSKLNFKSYLNYYETTTSDKSNYPEIKFDIKRLLTNSVKLQYKDIMNNQNLDYGVLLSGGLDSSLVTSIIAKEMNKTGGTLKTFSIGMTSESPDIIAAKKVVEYLKNLYQNNSRLTIEHHCYHFTEEEGLNSLKDVIWYTETYDTTTIRAGTAMYLLTKKIKENYPNLKVLFSGELSDELLCYLYGSNAPSIRDFQIETLNLVSNVHLFDCLRANKTCMANSIEVRVPFTDPNFINYILSLDPKYKVFGNLNKYAMEKQVLRDSFTGYLPKSILYRKKEQFSDGVSCNGFNWITTIQKFTNTAINNLEFAVGIQNYTINKPETKEQLYYRQMFCKLFQTGSFSNTCELTVKFWKPKWTKSTDPSARVYSKEHFTG
jgi:asparagine synthase (glutamine-hydrolysing)